jgi:hypothetical protein
VDQKNFRLVRYGPPIAQLPPFEAVAFPVSEAWKNRIDKVVGFLKGKFLPILDDDSHHFGSQVPISSSRVPGLLREASLLSLSRSRWPYAIKIERRVLRYPPVLASVAVETRLL